jgi:transposase
MAALYFLHAKLAMAPIAKQAKMRAARHPRKPLAMDLLVRLLASVEDGMNCRAAAAHFGVAPSTVILCHTQRRDAGDFAAKPQGGDVRSHRVEERASGILAVWEAQKDITLVEVRSGLAEMGLAISVAGLHRFFARRGMTCKKD